MWSTSDTPRPYVHQLIRAFAGLAVGIGLAVPLILWWTTWQQARLYSMHTAQELAAILAADARYALIVGSRPDAQTLVDTLLKFPDLVQVSLRDGAGRVVAERADPAPARRTMRVVAAVSTAAAEPAQAPLGQVVLTLSLDRAFTFALDTARASLLQLAVLTLLLGVAVARLSARMLGPLATLAQALDAPPEQALPRPPARSPAEVHRIAAAISAMRRRLAEHALQLEARVRARTEELRLARDAAEAANRAKTLFLANVSHELRTPLQAIILHARLLARGQPRPGAPALAVILRASNQLLELIEQLLNLSRLEAGQPLELTYQSFALPALLEEVAATLRPTLAAHNRLELLLEARELTLVSDRARLTQVLYNLVRNADKFTDGGHIRLRLARAAGGTHALIEVSDQGIGIAPDDLERIFAPFYQGLGGIDGRISSGIGLGLWLSRRLVAALGGDITVTSTPGVGSCFRLALPLLPSSPVAPAVPLPAVPLPAVPPPPAAHLRGRRLLLAEDEASIRAPLTVFLREAGFTLDACADGQAALALLAPSGRDYAALILDQRMPGAQGVEILTWLRTRAQRTTPVIILTGDDRAALQAAISRLGAQLLVKPVLPERLIATLAALIDPPARADPHTSDTR